MAIPTYLTGNPLGSVDVKDLYDNAQVTDAIVNSQEETVNDRFGRPRLTFHAMETAAPEAIDARDAARQAAEDAEAARDAANIAGKVYATPAAGVAAGTGVAPGQYFNVRSPGDDSYMDEYQNVGGNPVATGKSYPTTALLLENTVSSGEKLESTRSFGQQFNGAQPLAVGGVQRGFIVPTGQSGSSSYTSGILTFSQDESARLNGKRVRLHAVFTATPGFMADLPLSALFMQLYTGGNYPTNTGTLISRRQVGDQLHVEIEQDWLFSYDGVGPTIQINGESPVASKDYSIVLTSMTYRVVSNSGALSDADETVSAAFGKSLDPDSTRILIGQPYIDADQIAEVFNGASAIIEGGRPVGIMVPVGQFGTTSYLLNNFEIGQVPPFAMAGEQLRIRMVMDVSPGYSRAMTLKALTQYGPMNISRELAFSGGRLYTNGKGQFVQEGVITLVGDETQLRPYIQIVGGPEVTGAAQTMRLSALEMEFVRDDANITAHEKTLRMQEHLRFVIADRYARLGFSDAMNEGFRGGIEAAGGQFHRDADTRIDGWVIPAGQTAAGTYLQMQSMVPEFIGNPSYIGRQVRLGWFFNVTAGYSREILATMQVIFNGGVGARSVGIEQSRRGLVTPTLLYLEGTYTVVGDEDELRPYLVQQSVAVAGAQEELYLRRWGMSFTDVRDPGALGGEALTTLLRNERNAKKIDQKAAASVGSLKAYSTFQPQFFEGATQLEVGGKKAHGWSMPAASLGGPTLLQYLFNWGSTPTGDLTGRIMRLSFSLRVSVPYTRSFRAVVQVFRPAGAFDVANLVVNDAISSGGARRFYEVEFALDGTESGIGPYLQSLYGAAPSGLVETLEILDVEARIVYSPNGANALRAENEALAMRYALYRSSQGSSGETATVELYKDQATGLMPSFVTTLAGLSDASSLRRYEIMHHGGVQRASDINFQMRHFVDFTGISKDTAVFAAAVLPDDFPIADIQNQQSMYFNTTGRIKGITILGKNCRYPVHADSGNGVQNYVQHIENCYIEHLGNDGARAYQATIPGGNPAAVWSSEHAWGCGNSSGSQTHFISTELRSPTSPLYWHTNGMFTKPSIVTAEDCKFICTKLPGSGAATYSSVYVQPLGSFQQDQGIINKCLMNADVVYDPLPWIAQNDLAHQCANHAEIALSGSGNSGVHPFRHIDRGERALRITSANGSTASAIEVSGTAVPVLFGDGTIGLPYYTKPGGGGLRGNVYGWNDVGDAPRGYPNTNISVTMGTRLGNCTIATKTLTVKVNGVETMTHTFNQNYTGQSNAAILAQINTTLGASATADLFNPTMLYRPSWTDQEAVRINSTLIGIPMGSVVAFDANGYGVRLMTSADDRSLYAGVAWEDIYPGKPGRVKNDGHLMISDVRRTDPEVAIARGESLSVSATPGVAVKGGTQNLLTAVRAGVVQVKLS